MSDKDWRPMSEAPKEGTTVRLRLEDMDGPYEIDGLWRWIKVGAQPPYWHRDGDNRELHVAPHSWRLAHGVLL